MYNRLSGKVSRCNETHGNFLIVIGFFSVVILSVYWVTIGSTYFVRGDVVSSSLREPGVIGQITVSETVVGENVEMSE